jgi:hypothetical protein
VLVERTRTAAPPTSGPVSAHTLLKKRVLTSLKRPPRAQIAPPPSYSPSFFELAVDERQVLHREARVILVGAVGRGPHLRLVAGVHVQDAVWPAPLSVTRPPPSITIFGPVSLKIFAVDRA